jgi:FdhE protein
LTRDGWLEAHPYLRPLGDFSARVEHAASGLVAGSASIARWDDLRPELLAGVPLLHAADAPIDLEPAGRSVAALVHWLASGESGGRRKDEAAALEAELRSTADVSSRIVTWLLGDESWSPPSPGLLRYLGWTAMARFLRPVVEAFDRWRDDERWLRPYCPTCGSGPTMAQLVGKDPGRRRLLVCGRCAGRWGYRRAQCPFCEKDSYRASILAIEGEAGLRIDHCDSCRGYLKTYDGQENQDLLLLDWTSLHLDLIARDRGLKRLAASLYALEDDPAAPVEEDRSGASLPTDSRERARPGR